MRITARLAALAFLFLASAAALAQPAPGPGPVPDPWIVNGNQISSPFEIVANPPTTASAGFNFGVGVCPASPVDGDMCITISNIYFRVNGAWVSPAANYTAPSHQFLTGISSGVPTSTQPSFSDISGTLTAAQLATALPSTSALYKGTGGVGVAQAATPGTDYITPSEQTSAIATALPSTAALYKGTSGAGVSQAATPGTDYVTPSSLNTTLASPPAIGGTAPAAIASTTLNPTGAITVKVRSSAASSVTVSATTDYLLCLDPTSNAITVNLPASPATGLTFLVKDCTLKANTHNITVTPNSGNIDNASTYVMNTNGQSVAVTYTGSQWSVN